MLILRDKIKLFFWGLLSLLLSTTALADSQYSQRELEWLGEYIRATDYTARLKPISVVILDDLSDKQENDYYQYVTTYQVLETYKGELPEYIVVIAAGEFSKKHDTKQYYTKNGELVVIAGLCKGKDSYYFPETHSTYADVDIVKKLAKREGMIEASTHRNKCNK